MKRLLILLLLLLPGTAGAADHYINAAVSGGSDTGADWTNAWATLPAKLTRGDTYYIADGEYAPYTFDDAESDTTSIMIRKATVARHGTETGWDNAYGDGQAVFTGAATVWTVTTNNWVFDGVSATDDTSGHGIKLAPTAGATRGIVCTGADSLTIRYIEIAHRGLDTETADDGIYTLGNTDVLMQYCYLHDFGRVPFLTRSCKYWTVEYCYIARNSSSAGQHSEAWSDALSDTMTVRYNTFADIEGTAVIALMNNATTGSNNFSIYGNLFFRSHGNPYNRESLGNGSIATATADYAYNCLIYNNTFVNLSGAAGIYISNGTGGVAYNNLWYNCERASFTGIDNDYNWLVNTTLAAGLPAGAHDVQQADSTGVFTDHLSYDFTLAEASAVVGYTLASPYNADKAAATRGSDGLWDAGAYEYEADAGGGEAGIHTYYVHPDSSGTGTALAPFGTIAEAEAVADSNDVILLAGNLAGQKITYPADGVTYRSWTSTPAIIGGAKPLTGWLAETAGGSGTINTDSDVNFNDSTHAVTSASTTIDVGRFTTPAYTMQAGVHFTLTTTNFASFDSVTLALRCTLNRTGTVKLKFKLAEHAAIASSDSDAYQEALANAFADSITLDIVNPASGTTYYVDVTTLFSQLTIDGSNEVLVLIQDNGTASNNLYFRFAAIEHATEPEASISVVYTQSSGATRSYRELTGDETSATRFWRNNVAGTSVAFGEVNTAGEYYASGDSIYVAIEDTSGWSCDGYGANAIDFNEITDGVLSGITILGTGYSGHAVYADGSRNSIYNINIDRAKKGIYALGDTITFRNIAFAVTDTLLTETGEGATYSHNGFDTDYEVPASPGANDVLAAELWTGENYEPTEEMRDKGYDVGLPYNGSAPDIGAGELKALIVDTTTFRRGYGVGRWGDALQKRWGGSPW